MFAGRILETRDIVEIVMIELRINRRERGLQICEVEHPAAIGAQWTGDVDGDAKRMTVQAGTLMPRRHIREAVGSLEGEFLEDLHVGQFSAIGGFATRVATLLRSTFIAEAGKRVEANADARYTCSVVRGNLSAHAMHTIRLIYSSDAREGLRYRDFLTMMEKAAAKNSEHSITGMLCHGGGKFLQALEGERVAVNALYHYIATDLRHSRCRLISVEEIGRRDFAEWSMKIIDWTDAASVKASSRTAMLEKSGSSSFDPDAMTAEQAGTFLRTLAEAERALLE